MKNAALILLFVVIAAVGFYVKAWQCGEMFPNADLLACVFWR